MPLPLAIPIAAMGLQAASGVGQMFQAKKQRKFQKQMATTAYQRDTETWNKANAYNAPQAQMERLKEAGLNPNMIYGSGTAAATGQTSTSMPKHQNYQTPVADLSQSLPNMLGILGQYADIKGKTLSNDAQAMTNYYLNDKLGTEQTIRYDKSLKGQWDTGRAQANENLNWWMKTSPYGTKSQQSIRAADQSNQLKQVQIDFYKTIPKQYQWIAPLLMRLIK